MRRKKRLHPQLQREKDREEIDNFLADLKEVYVKHNLIVGACGCCDSPLVMRPKRGSLLSTLAHLESNEILDQ